MLNFKRTLMGAAALVISASFLTACETVKGTAEGAERDIHNAKTMMTDDNKPAQHKRMTHKTMKKQDVKSDAHHSSTMMKKHDAHQAKQTNSSDDNTY